MRQIRLKLGAELIKKSDQKGLRCAGIRQVAPLYRQLLSHAVNAVDNR